MPGPLMPQPLPSLQPLSPFAPQHPQWGGAINGPYVGGGDGWGCGAGSQGPSLAGGGAHAPQWSSPTGAMGNGCSPSGWAPPETSLPVGLPPPRPLHDSQITAPMPRGLPPPPANLSGRPVSGSPIRGAPLGAADQEATSHEPPQAEQLEAIAGGQGPSA